MSRPVPDRQRPDGGVDQAPVVEFLDRINGAAELPPENPPQLPENGRTRHHLMLGHYGLQDVRAEVTWGASGDEDVRVEEVPHETSR